MNASKIRKELAVLRNKLIISGVNSNEASNQARKAMNDKYGKGWREKEYNNKEQGKTETPSIYDEHTNGEHWME